MTKINLFRKSIYVAVASLLFFTACNDEEVKPGDDINDSGSDSLVLKTTNVLIFHEGGFQSNNATIGSYKPEEKEYNPTSFRDENGSFIGDVQQSVISNEGLLYSVLNGTNAVKVLDSASLSLSATIEDDLIDKPRSLAIRANTAYLSTWGPYDENFQLTDSRVVTIDLGTNSVTGSIETEEGLENVLIVDNTLLATRNYFGGFQNLSLINLENNEIIADIELPAGPSEILQDESGDVWVVCSSGALVKVDVGNASISETIELGGSIFGDAAVHEGFIYFLQANEVKSFEISTNSINSITSTKEITTPYAFGVDPVSGDIYIGDGVDYSDGGTVLVYSIEGELLDEFVSGILPTQFIFETEEVAFEED